MTPLPADNRLHHIDAMRAIAALCVVIMHFCTRLPDNIVSSSFIGDVLTLDFGRIGVVLFFAISGFVIPGSLQPCNQGSIKWYFGLGDFSASIRHIGLLCALLFWFSGHLLTRLLVFVKFWLTPPCCRIFYISKTSRAFTGH
ncbi:acyltransferase family protein [Dickeya zeae]|uniref:acyltransferase family protein n=1 Tax=Dickeya zeae TaxID=204042 RepID=UPI0034D32C1E